MMVCTGWAKKNRTVFLAHPVQLTDHRLKSVAKSPVHKLSHNVTVYSADHDSHNVYFCVCMSENFH